MMPLRLVTATSTGCAAGVLTAAFAGHEKTGESYGYDPNSNSFKNTPDYKMTPVFVPGIVASAVYLIAGLGLQFTAKDHPVKAIEIHNASITKGGSPGILFRLYRLVIGRRRAR